MTAQTGLAWLFGEKVEPDTKAEISPTTEANKAIADLKSLFGEE